MDSTFLLLAGLGGRIDKRVLGDMIAKMNDKRRRLFSKLAELLFGAVMFFFGDLEMKVEKPPGSGNFVDADHPSVTEDEKLKAIAEGLKVQNKGNLFREFMRPFLIAAAEVVADLMAPNPLMLQLIGIDPRASGSPAPLGGFPALPFGPFAPPVGAAAPQAPPVNPNAPRGSAADPNPAPSRRRGIN